jgi:hypothetical protein
MRRGVHLLKILNSWGAHTMPRAFYYYFSIGTVCYPALFIFKRFYLSGSLTGTRLASGGAPLLRRVASLWRSSRILLVSS